MLGLSLKPAERDPLGLLVEQAQGGKSGAFEALIASCQGRILRLAQRLLGAAEDAQDVAQETFVLAFTHLAELDGRRSPLGWLTTVATRLCLNRLRTRGRLQEWPDEYEPLDPGPPLEAMWFARENQHQLHQAILQLSETARAVVVLHYLEEWSCQQVAEALQMTESNVKVMLFRSRDRLRKILCQK